MDIKRLALFLRALALLGAALVIARPFMGWSTPQGPFVTQTDIAFAAAMPRPGAASLAALALLLPPYAVITWGLLQLAGFCRQIEREQHFTGLAARALARLGWAIVVAALLLPLTRWAALAGLFDRDVWSAAHAAFRLPTLISVTMGLIFGTIIVLFSALLDKSVQLQEENSSFV